MQESAKTYNRKTAHVCRKLGDMCGFSLFFSILYGLCL
jgi:hypothetical protein